MGRQLLQSFQCKQQQYFVDSVRYLGDTDFAFLFPTECLKSIFVLPELVGEHILSLVGNAGRKILP